MKYYKLNTNSNITTKTGNYIIPIGTMVQSDGRIDENGGIMCRLMEGDYINKRIIFDTNELTSVNIDNDKVIYKIDHYYNINHEDSCLLISSSIPVEKFIQIIAGVQFKFEELIDETICADETHVLEILKNFYGVMDVKENYKEYLTYTQLKDCDWEITNYFYIKDINLLIIQIDSYEARESCCGNKYYETLPKDEKIEEYIKSLRSFYIKNEPV